MLGGVWHGELLLVEDRRSGAARLAEEGNRPLRQRFSTEVVDSDARDPARMIQLLPVDRRSGAVTGVDLVTGSHA